MICIPKGFMFMNLPAFAGGELVVVFQSENRLERTDLTLDCPGSLYLSQTPGPKDWSPLGMIPSDWKLIGKVPTAYQVFVTVAYLNIEGLSVLLHHVFIAFKSHTMYFVPI